MKFADVRDVALRMTEPDRAELARELIASLDAFDDDVEDAAVVDSAWSQEIARRVREVVDGTAELHDGESVFAEARARLAALGK